MVDEKRHYDDPGAIFERDFHAREKALEFSVINCSLDTPSGEVLNRAELFLEFLADDIAGRPELNRKVPANPGNGRIPEEADLSEVNKLDPHAPQAGDVPEFLKREQPETIAPAATGTVNKHGVALTPKVLETARKYNLPIEQLDGTGKDHRTTQGDVETLRKQFAAGSAKTNVVPVDDDPGMDVTGFDDAAVESSESEVAPTNVDDDDLAVLMGDVPAQAPEVTESMLRETMAVYAGKYGMPSAKAITQQYDGATIKDVPPVQRPPLYAAMLHQIEHGPNA